MLKSARLDVVFAVISILQTLDPFFLAIISAPIYYFFVLLFFRFFGAVGVMSFLAIAVMGANVQVLKLSYFSFYQQPVALGTALFSSTFFATDLLNEHYGRKMGAKAVMLSFFSMFLWLFIVTHVIAYAPLTAEQSGGKYDWALPRHEALRSLFSITPAITFASLLAFIVSQMNDIFIFQYIKKKTKGRFLFLRNNLSTFISVLIDNIVFSFSAFYFFADDPVPLKVLVVSYIFSTYGLRIFLAVLDTPFLYLSRHRFFQPRWEWFEKKME